jgi:hypothetical protein
MVELEQRTPEELRRLLATEGWQQLFAEVATVSPMDSPQDAVTTFFGHYQITPRFTLERMAVVDRATAERFVAVLLQHELAYKNPRLPRAEAVAAAAAFLHPFGAATRFYANIDLTPEILAAKEAGAPCSFCVNAHLFDSTFEAGLIAFDPAGLVGALFVGDED